MRKLISMAMAVIALSVSSVNATVRINPIVTSDSFPAIDNTGTLAMAVNFGGETTVRNGIPFQNLTHGNKQHPTATFNAITISLLSGDNEGCNQAFLGDELWHTSSYTDRGGDFILHITGLDKTRKYRVQYLHGEPRENSWAKYIDGPITMQDAFSHSVSETITFGNGYLENVLVTFEASGSDALTLTLAGGYGVFPGAAGLAIHDIGPDDVAPEARDLTTQETLAVTDIPMTYRITFSEEMTAPVTGIFSNAGTALIDIDSVTVQEPANCYDVTITPRTPGTLYLRLAAGMIIMDLAGNAATLDNDLISNKGFVVLRPHAAFTTASGDWSVNNNWTPDLPAGVDSATISDGHSMVVTQAVPAYSAGLILTPGSSLSLENVPGVENALSESVVMDDGCYIGMDCGFTVTVPSLIMAGSGEIEMSTRSEGHDTTRQFGSIEGAGTLTIEGNNKNYIDFNAMNSHWSGGLVANAADRYIIRANKIGCFGTGDITVNPRPDERSATIRLGAHDVFDPRATLSLAGIGSADWNYESGVLIDMQGYNSWVNKLYIYGTPISPGVYTGTDASWITGAGYLTVLGDPEAGSNDTAGSSVITPLETDLVSSFAALKYHVLGYTILTDPEIAAHKATIDVNKSLYSTSPFVMKAAFNFVETYETAIGPLWTSESPIPYNFDRVNEPDHSIDWIAFNVMQDLIDHVYTVEVIARCESYLAGKLFLTSARHPGAVDPPADPEVTHTATINASYPDTLGWDDSDFARKPTGTYVAPGSIVTVRVPEALVGKGYLIRIGCHSWDLSGLNTVKRMDRMSITYPINSTVTKVGNPLGGGIYIEVPIEASEGLQDIVITGAVRSPLFSHNTITGQITSLSDWQNTERHHPGPWADFITEKYQCNVPTDWIYNKMDPWTPMKDWNKAMKAADYLMGLPYERGRESYYAVVDVIMRGTAFHPGYPTGNDVYHPETDYGGDHSHYLVSGPELIITSGTGHGDFAFHEKGHGYFFDKFDGEIESAVNLIDPAVWHLAFGHDLDAAFSMNPNNTRPMLDETAISWMFCVNFVAGNEMASWEKKYYPKGHAKFVHIAKLFGWDKLHDFYRQLNLDGIYKYNPCPGGDDERILRLAIATGVDIRPLLHFWGIHPDPEWERASELEGFPQSREIYNDLVKFRSLIPQDRAAFQAFAQTWWGYPPSPNGFSTERSHADYWDTYDENDRLAITAIVDSIIDQYFPDGDPGLEWIVPEPNPMTWELPPAAPSEGQGDRLTEIVMTATTATDDSGVEYYFEELSGNPGGDDSGWQDSPYYKDTGLTPGLPYIYRVIVRDKSSSQNETEPSIAVPFTAGLECSTCGDLNGSGGLTDLADFAVMSRCWGEDPAFLPECLSANLVEFGKSTIDLLDLMALAELYLTTSQFYPPNCMTSVTDPYSPVPEVLSFTVAPYATGNSSAAMVAEPATDPSGVEYYFRCDLGGGHDSGWQDSNSYEDTGLTPGQTYAYTVIARDKSVNQNVTSESAKGYVTLAFNGISIQNSESPLILDNSGTFELALNLSYDGTEITQDGITFISVNHADNAVSPVFGSSANGITISGDCPTGGFSKSTLGSNTLWHTDTFTPSQGGFSINITGLNPVKKYRLQILNGEPRENTLYNNGAIMVTDSSGNVMTNNLSFGHTAGGYALTAIHIKSTTSASYYIPRADRGPSFAGIVIHSEN